MCVCVCVCVCVCACVSVCVSECVYVYVCKPIRMCVGACVYVCKQICMTDFYALKKKCMNTETNKTRLQLSHTQAYMHTHTHTRANTQSTHMNTHKIESNSNNKERDCHQTNTQNQSVWTAIAQTLHRVYLTHVQCEGIKHGKKHTSGIPCFQVISDADKVTHIGSTHVLCGTSYLIYSCVYIYICDHLFLLCLSLSLCF